MITNSHPTFGNGKICYLEIPANDVQLSALFYEKTFNWKIRNDTDGNFSFDDAVGEVSGMWILGRKPSTDTGIMISIMVDSIADTVKLIAANGGQLIQETSAVTALFADPAGNMMCLYESRH